MNQTMSGGGFIWMIVMGIIMVVPFWKISKRAGFNGALGLLVLIPLVNLAFFYFLAFASWPRDKRESTA